ncbi:hypothetical protein ACU4HD_19195 [Cupriavidus basilensis]
MSASFINSFQLRFALSAACGLLLGMCLCFALQARNAGRFGEFPQMAEDASRRGRRRRNVLRFQPGGMPQPDLAFRLVYQPLGEQLQHRCHFIARPFVQPRINAIVLLGIARRNVGARRRSGGQQIGIDLQEFDQRLLRRRRCRQAGGTSGSSASSARSGDPASQPR